MKQRLATVLDEYGGTVDFDSLNESVKREFKNYVMLSGVNPILVPTELGVQSAPPSRIAQIHFVKKWGINAVTSLADEAPILLVFAGTPFALVDYFNRLLAYQEVLTDFDGSQEIARFEDDALKLDLDYAGFISNKFPDSIPLTSADSPDGWAVAPGAQRYVSWQHYLPLKPKSK